MDTGRPASADVSRTWSAWVRWGTERLQQAGVEAPRREAESLVASVVGVSRWEGYLHPDLMLNEAQVESVQALLERRARRVPAQYLTGWETFCGLEIAVTPAVLIPRPETEGVVLAARQAAQGTGDRRPPIFADVGTGSGCIALALAAGDPASVVYAIDRSADALAVARANAARLDPAGHVRFRMGDLVTPLREEGLRVDVLVSNPPYVSDEEFSRLQPEVRYEPPEALRGGPDGLMFYRRLFTEAAGVLHPAGAVVVEVGFGQAALVRELAEGAGYVVERVEEDLAGIPRVITVRSTARTLAMSGTVG